MNKKLFYFTSKKHLSNCSRPSRNWSKTLHTKWKNYELAWGIFITI